MSLSTGSFSVACCGAVLVGGAHGLFLPCSRRCAAPGRRHRHRAMQAEEVKSRFGRCPYCRAMIYQDLTAIIFYCSKCRTPIRGTGHGSAARIE